MRANKAVAGALAARGKVASRAASAAGSRAHVRGLTTPGSADAANKATSKNWTRIKVAEIVAKVEAVANKAVDVMEAEDAASAASKAASNSWIRFDVAEVVAKVAGCAMVLHLLNYRY